MVTFQPLTMYCENLAYGLVTGVSGTITGTGWVGLYWAVWMSSPFGAEGSSVGCVGGRCACMSISDALNSWDDAPSTAFATELMNGNTIAAKLAYLAGAPFIRRIITSPPSYCEVAWCATTVLPGTLIAPHDAICRCGLNEASLSPSVLGASVSLGRAVAGTGRRQPRQRWSMNLRRSGAAGQSRSCRITDLSVSVGLGTREGDLQAMKRSGRTSRQPWSSISRTRIHSPSTSSYSCRKPT